MEQENALVVPLPEALEELVAPVDAHEAQHVHGDEQPDPDPARPAQELHHLPGLEDMGPGPLDILGPGGLLPLSQAALKELLGVFPLDFFHAPLPSPAVFRRRASEIRGGRGPGAAVVLLCLRPAVIRRTG